MKKVIGDELHIQSGLSTSAGMAYSQTLKAGIPVTVLRGKEICKVYPDGNKEVLGTVQHSKCKVAKTYSLKK
jgi:hypothetical protein